MSRFIFINGEYKNHVNANVHVEDRGYQFSDGVYEVSAIWGKSIIDEDLHYERLERSLSGLSIELPMPIESLKVISREIIRKNLIIDGIIYLQISRGVAPRNHVFPKKSQCSVVLTAQAMNWPTKIDDNGINIITTNDLRWQRRDLKSISLLPNILAKQEAFILDAYESWLVDERGFITEGASSNAWIVDHDDVLITRELSNSILGGVTRHTLIKIARENGMTVLERPFLVDEAKKSKEVFLTSTTSGVKGVTKIDGEKIGMGKAGKITEMLHKLYTTYCINYGK